MRKMQSIEDQLKIEKNILSISLFCFEFVIIMFYGFFIRYEIITQTDAFTSDFYSIFQDVNVMMLIGFGFLMTFIKSYSWSALSYTFFTYAIGMQVYHLAHALWYRVFLGGEWGDPIYLTQQSLTLGVYAIAAVLISLGGVLGRISMLHMLIMTIIEVFAYALNQIIVYELVKIYDVGGSMPIHSFGAVCGMVICTIISKKLKPTKAMPISHTSMTFAFIGTFYLWLFWPSFNCGYFAINSFERSIIVINTVLSLTGSVVGTYVTTSIGRKKFSIEQILNSTLAGGVIIGATAGLLVNPAGALTIGFIGGIVSSLGYHYLSAILEHKLGIYDSCGINNLHGMPGILGGIASAIVIAAYGSSGLSAADIANLQFASHTFFGRDFNTQAWIQLAGLGISVGIGLITGLIIGAIIYATYQYKSGNQYYEDSYDFEVPEIKNQVNPEIVFGSSRSLNSKIEDQKPQHIETLENLK